MSGVFGVVAREDCVADLFYGTDYHSHLGTVRGGMAISNGNGFTRVIHDITNAQFRSKFEDDLGSMQGPAGIGVISDYEDQPLIIGSHLGTLRSGDGRPDRQPQRTWRPRPSATGPRISPK